MDQYLKDWEDVRRQVTARWDRLPDHDLDETFGDPDLLADLISQEYGINKGQAIDEVFYVIQHSGRNGPSGFESTI